MSSTDYPTRFVRVGSILVKSDEVGITNHVLTQHRVTLIVPTGVYTMSAGDLSERYRDWEKLRVSYRVLEIRQADGTGSNRGKRIERWYLHKVAN